MKTKDDRTKIKNYKPQTVASHILLCFFAAFGVCFFVPMDIFLANIGDITFPIKPLALFMGTVTLAVFAVLFIVCMLTRSMANNIFRAIVFGVSAAFYIQGNFLAVNMGQLDGSRYDLSAQKAALSIVIWLVILAAPFFILIKFPKIFDNVLFYVPAAIILIQALALGISAYSNLKYGSINQKMIFEGDTRRICTPADLDTYSKNKNLIIILADEYDSLAFDSAIADDPDSVSEFDGFTYYTDTVGKFHITGPSLAYIFSGNKEGNFDDLTFFDTVSANYRSNFYCNNAIPLVDIEKYSDNIVPKKITLWDTRGYADGIYRIAFFRCMPEILKPFFQSSGDIGQELREKTDEIIGLKGGIPEYSHDNLDFYRSIPREIKTTDENVFKYMYIIGLHETRTVTRDLERAPENADVSVEEEAVAVNKIVNEYLKTLKDNGVYDNSEIIFMADHGHYNGKKFPLLMYKPAYQTGTGIKVSNARISYDEMFPTLIMLAGGEPNGRTIFDIGENEERVRYFGTDNKEIAGSVKQDAQ